MVQNERLITQVMVCSRYVPINVPILCYARLLVYSGKLLCPLFYNVLPVFELLGRLIFRDGGSKIYVDEV